MIEIVYDKRTAEEEAKNYTSYKMPKNIRQIGNTPDKRRIYIEDYVMTYLRKIAEPGNTTSRGAILLGEYFKEGETETLFISGAVEAQNLEFDVDRIKFDDQIWSALYSDINKYFEHLSVVGWFLSRMGFSTEVNDKITRLHHENFRGQDKVLFVMDSLECEDAFYVYEKNRLVRQRGYYIYYVRNEAMQNYIISRKNTISEDKNDEALRKDAELVKNFQQMRSDDKIQGKKTENKKKNKSYFAYTAASFALIFALSMGIVVSGNYDKIKDIESAVKKLELENGEDEIQVFSNSSSEESIYTNDIEDEENNSDEAENKNEEQQDIGSEDEDAETSENTDNEKETEAEISSADEALSSGNSTYYTIEEGDTLMSISIKMYDSPNYVDEIMKANNINEGDTIYPGEKIAIPYVK